MFEVNEIMLDKNKEQKKSDKKLDEKRVKPTVIRRRAAQPVEAEKEESVKKLEQIAEPIKKAEVKPVKEQVKPEVAPGKKPTISVKSKEEIIPPAPSAKEEQHERKEFAGKLRKFEKLEKFEKIRPPTQARELKKTEITVPKATKR